MTKGQIHFSNHLEELIPLLKEHLYPPGTTPFEKRLLIVPHLGWKSDLMQALAGGSPLQAVAGLHIANLSQGYAKITKKNFPGKMELSFFLQHEILPLIEEEPALASYFHKETRDRRIGPFCDALATYFLRYAVFGKNQLPSWQEKLWEKWNWENVNVVSTQWQIYLFGFSFLPKFYFDCFARLGANMYFFSPCEIFWGDFYSPKERKNLRKGVPKAKLDVFETSFSEQNPLLANWGKVGRVFHLAIEESGVPTQEFYVEPEGESCLEKVQRDLLQGSFSRPLCDDSVSFVSAPSFYREVEACKDQVLHLFHTKGMQPKEIQIFAPDISPYVPYIHAIFSDIAYGISDISRREEDPIAKAFEQLLQLPKRRFVAEEVLQVFTKLSKFSLDLSLVRKWVEKGHIRFGGSEKGRKIFYLKDCEEEHICANSPLGTWEFGLDQLLLGIGHVEGIQAVGPAEMEEFDKFYRLFHALEEDLSPLYDGTKWTIPTWLRYLASLLESYLDSSCGLYRELLQMAVACKDLSREETPFEGVERVLHSLLSKKSEEDPPPHLQAIHFGSLIPGCLQPSKAIFLLGMQEEAFPRQEEKTSLYCGERDFCPRSAEQDRYLFLEAVCFAQEFFSVSYLRDGKGELGPSSLIEEWMGVIEEAKIFHHLPVSFDSQYFEEKGISYNKRAFHILQGKESFSPPSPLIPDFYQPISLALPELQPMKIDLQKLIKFARHPLRYFLHEVLGIYPEFGKASQQHYLLDPLTKHKIVRKALRRPLCDVLEEVKGELPVHLLQSLAIRQIEEEVGEWQEAMETFGIDPEELETKKISLAVGPVVLQGKLELFSEKGLLVKGKNGLEDRVKFWPQALLMKTMGLPLLFSKDQTMYTPEGSLEEYLAYFQLAKKHPSPCVPSLAQALLTKNLRKELKKIEDDVFSYLFFRDPLPNPTVIEENWSELLQKIFGETLATI